MAALNPERRTGPLERWFAPLKRSLQGRLILSLAVLFLTLTSLQVWEHLSQARTIRDLREAADNNAARLTASGFDTSLEHAVAGQRLLAQAAFGSSMPSPVAQAYLSQAARQFSGLASLQVYGPDGLLLFSEPSGAPMLPPPLFRRLRPKDPVLLSRVYSSSDGQGERFRVVTLALTPGGEPAGAVSMEFFTNVLAEWVPATGGDNLQVILDSAGHVAYSNQGTLSPSLSKAIAELAASRRTDREAAAPQPLAAQGWESLRIVPIAHGGWSAAYLEPQAAALAWARWESGLVYLVLISILSLTAGGLLLAVRYSLRPVTRLAAASRRLASGDLTLRLERPEIQEFDALVDAFNRMAAELQAAQAQLQASNDRLEATVAERTGELEQEHQRLLRAERLSTLGILAGGIAHDLRNPLNSISMSAQMLKRRLQSTEDASVLKRVEVIEREIQRATRIFDTLLAFARTGEPNRRPTPVAELLEKVREACRDLPPAQIRIQDPPVDFSLDIDTPQLVQVLENLVRNGAQAIDDDGQVCVEARLEEDAWRLEVRDTGPGVPPEIRETLFEPLVSRRAGGTGLGLALADRIVRAHGGVIEVESEPGRGTTFRVVLPKPEQGSQANGG